MARKRTKITEDEMELRRQELENGIVRRPTYKRPPHETIHPVGEDEREYLEDELTEQGYTDMGLENPNDADGDEDIEKPGPGRKIA